MNKKIYGIFIIAIVGLMTLSTASAWWIFGDDQNLEEYKQTYCKGVVIGNNTPAGKQGYHYSLIDDDQNIIYITDDCMVKLSGYNNQFALMKDYYNKNGDSIEETGKLFDLEFIEFKYEYENKTVGENENQPVITKVYYTNGTEMENITYI